jgi:hypothetical protein
MEISVAKPARDEFQVDGDMVCEVRRTELARRMFSLAQ